MKNIFLMFVLAFTVTACAVTPINFNDGTWSDCTYSKDGRVVTGPVQLGGAPLEWTEPDGTSVKCMPRPVEKVE